MIFLETKSKRNKKQAEPQKKTQTEQTGKWFFKRNSTRTHKPKPLERKTKTDTYTLKRMQRENKRTGEILSKNNKQNKKKENMKQQKN